jgi:hypothetical protein
VDLLLLGLNQLGCLDPPAFGLQLSSCPLVPHHLLHLLRVVRRERRSGYPLALVNLLGTRRFIFAVLDQPASMRLTDATFQAPMFWLNTAAELSISRIKEHPAVTVEAAL